MTASLYKTRPKRYAGAMENVTKGSPAEDKLRRGFDYLYDEFPFLAGFLSYWKTSLYESHQIPTAATDGPNLYFNRKFFDSLSPVAVEDVMLHEAAHVFFGHHFRMGDRDPRGWNQAADLALNYNLAGYYRSAEIKSLALFPGKGGFLNWPLGETAETYYDLLPKKARRGQGQGGKGGQPSGTPGDLDGAGQGEPGSSSSADPAEIGEILPHPGNMDDPAEREEAEQEWRRMVVQGIATAKMCGSVPGWAVEAAEVLTSTKKIDWRTLLRRFMTTYVRRGWTYERPNRRHGWRKDIIMPARRSYGASTGVVLLDTSGSMNVNALNASLGEVEAVLTVFEDCTVTLVQADTKISAERDFHRYDFPLRVPHEWRGRGGTELAPAIRELGARGKYAWMVVITDMEWSVANAKDPGIPTVWVSTTPQSSWSYGSPSFGQIVEWKP